MGITPSSRRLTLAVLVLSLAVNAAIAQTIVSPPKNRFSPQQDVEIGRKGAAQTAPATAAAAVGTLGQPVPPPSSEVQEITGGNVFRAGVPVNWTRVASQGAIKVVPENAYGSLNGRTLMTHGIEFGMAKATSQDLGEATNAWLKLIAQSNPELRPNGAQRSEQISRREAIATTLVNPSPLGGQEYIVVHTTLLVNGALFYYFTIVPEKDAEAFDAAFRRIGESIRLTDQR